MNIENNFSPNSKVWVYQSSRPFTADEIDDANELLSQFVKKWTAHNAQLHAAGKIIEDRLIMLIVDETHTAASGCSIDTSVHFIKSLENKFGIDLFDRTIVNFYNDGSLISAHLHELGDLYTSNVLNDDTLVIDPLVDSKAAFDSGFKTALRDSWIKNFL